MGPVKENGEIKDDTITKRVHTTRKGHKRASEEDCFLWSPDIIDQPDLYFVK